MSRGELQTECVFLNQGAAGFEERAFHNQVAAARLTVVGYALNELNAQLDVLSLGNAREDTVVLQHPLADALLSRAEPSALSFLRVFRHADIERVINVLRPISIRIAA